MDKKFSSETYVIYDAPHTSQSFSDNLKHTSLTKQNPSLLLILSTLTTILFTASGTLAYLFKEYYLTDTIQEYYKVNLGVAAVATGALGFVGLFVGSALYLGIIGSRPREKDIDVKSLKSLQKEVFEIRELLKENLKTSSAGEIRNAVHNVFSEHIMENIEAMFGNAFVGTAREHLSATYGPLAVRDKSISIVASNCSRMLADLKVQIDIQQRNANFNVLFGMLFSTAGLISMGVFVYYASIVQIDTQAKTWFEFLVSSLPKISFVLIFESIAFFFFRAYREDRSMVRYMRNEATNIEARLIGLSSALLFGSGDSISEAISSLMKTERNFLLKKGERAIINPDNSENTFLIERLSQEVVKKIRLDVADRKPDPT